MTLVDGFKLSPGDMLAILQFNTLSGEFAEFPLPVLAGGLFGNRSSPRCTLRTKQRFLPATPSPQTSIWAVG